MTTQQAYDVWASQYDSNHNKTRDLEGVAVRKILNEISFSNCLEIGCGTGKNTQWLMTKTNAVTAVDLSEEMLAKAKEKMKDNKVQFVQADVTKEWTWAKEKFDVITFSLVLEHIENLQPVFKKATSHLQSNGYAYVGELHPFKQYTGTKARFDTEEGRQVVSCFTHHISDFVQAAETNGLRLLKLKEYFDENDKTTIPRLLVLLFQKNELMLIVFS